MTNQELSKEQKSEIKKLKNDVKNELKIFKKVSVPEIQIAHLERIIRHYIRIHEIEKPSIPDKTALSMIRLQYRSMCVLRRIKPQRELL